MKFHRPKTWEELRTRIVAQMEKRYLKTADVARAIEQRPQRVSEWIGNEMQPRADITLKLLNYLEELETSR